MADQVLMPNQILKEFWVCLFFIVVFTPSCCANECWRAGQKKCMNLIYIVASYLVHIGNKATIKSHCNFSSFTSLHSKIVSCAIHQSQHRLRRAENSASCIKIGVFFYSWQLRKTHHFWYSLKKFWRFLFCDRFSFNLMFEVSVFIMT